MSQMNADEAAMQSLNALTDRVIGCAFRVGNGLGGGFLEKVYENALSHELRKAGLGVETQSRLSVHYDGVVVGDYVADLIVERMLLVEIKAVRTLDDAHAAQCLNYIAATRLPACLLLNFASKVHVRRFIRSDLLHAFPDLRSSASSAASSSVPMTWAEQAEMAELDAIHEAPTQ